MRLKKRTILSKIIFLLTVTIGGVLLILLFNSSEAINTIPADSREIQAIILDVLSQNSDSVNGKSHLTDEEFDVVQKYVKAHENQLRDYNPMSITDEYSIYIDRETRALFVKNAQNMARRLTWKTIDCNNYSDYDMFVCQNNRTYCIGKNVIAEYYLGSKIVEFDIPLKKPVILDYYMDDVVVTDGNLENTPLMICASGTCTEISNFFSGLPVEIYTKGLYYIDKNMSLYMYNLYTGQTTFIADDVYELFYSSGLNFKSKDGIYRINLYVSEYGNECMADVKSEVTDQKIEKWSD